MNTDINVLNDITERLIDSRKGYEKAMDVVDSHASLRSSFGKRANERAELINRFQDRVRDLGGDPTTDGSMTGALHQAWMKFSSLFEDDAEAALAAIDNGEERLADEIQKQIKQRAIDAVTTRLLEQAWVQVKDGEAFVDRMEKIYD